MDAVTVLSSTDIFQAVLIVGGFMGVSFIIVHPLVAGLTKKRLSRDCLIIGLLTLALVMLDRVTDGDNDPPSWIDHCFIVVGVLEILLWGALDYRDFVVKQRENQNSDQQ